MKALFISGVQINGKSTDANAVCNKAIIDGLKNHMQDIEIDVAAEDIFSNKKRIDRKKKALFKLERIMKWPCINPMAERECYAEIAYHMSQKKYDAIIAAHKPYETVSAAIRYKKKHPDVKLLIYALDPISNEIDRNIGRLRRNLFFLAKRSERTAFKYADHVFQMRCNYGKYSGERFKKFRNKFSYLDFPVIRDKGKAACTAEPYDHNCIFLIYSGTLVMNYRSPRYLAEVFKAFSESMPFQMNFYSKGNCEAYLKETEKECPCIKPCGYIPKDELDKKSEEADCFINIGNRYSSMLPSKLLAYFETGKPVIHVSNQANDACISYMERYPLGLVIYETDPVETSAEKVTAFLKKTYHARVSSRDVCKLYKENTPEWSAERISDVLIKLERGKRQETESI